MAVHTSNTSPFQLARFKKQPRSTFRKARLVPLWIGTPRHTCSMWSPCLARSNLLPVTAKHLSCVQARYCWPQIQLAQAIVGDSSMISLGGVFTSSFAYRPEATAIHICWNDEGSIRLRKWLRTASPEFWTVQRVIKT